MLKVLAKFIVILTAAVMLSRCIDPYSPKLTGYESLLVADGMITDENASYTVKLSRTLQEQDGAPEMISDAVIYITDDEAKRTNLKNAGSGIYKTDSIEFKGIVGRSYILHILTPEGAEYESEPCLMQSVPEIDSIYFEKDVEIINNGTSSNEGVRVYLDSKAGINNMYYRWDFEEIWKFKVPSPKKFDYLSDSLIVPVPEVNEYCWKSKKSDDVLIHSVYSGQSDQIQKEPVCFIDPNKSDRLLIQYSIMVRQYSISKKEYDFWDNMKKINESGNDIFATQPFPVISNIHNVNNPEEQVLGYFQVSAVKQKRKNIPFSDVVGMNLPYFNYPCERIEMAPQDYPRSPLVPPLTWDELYDMYCKTGDYYFVEPKYQTGTTKLEKLVFARPECANCTLTGTKTKPDFRVDIN
jgi:hypothetical protein